jgi:hypothetical protein
LNRAKKDESNGIAPIIDDEPLVVLPAMQWPKYGVNPNVLVVRARQTQISRVLLQRIVVMESRHHRSNPDATNYVSHDGIVGALLTQMVVQEYETL